MLPDPRIDRLSTAHAVVSELRLDARIQFLAAVPLDAPKLHGDVGSPPDQAVRSSVAVKGRITAIPYHLGSHRGPGERIVWLDTAP